MDTKNVVRSRTLWGIGIAVLPQILEAAGIKLLEGEPGAIVAGVGAVLGIFGRFRARQKLRVKPPGPLLPILLVVALLGTASWSLTGCATLRNIITERPATAEGVITYATLKVIKPGDTARAQRVVDLADFLAANTAGGQVTTAAALETLVRSQIKWDQLAAEDAALVDLLIRTIREELVSRFGAGELSEANRLAVLDVLGWIRSAARLRLPPA